jgi:SAM-dependent methyltransferase
VHEILAALPSSSRVLDLGSGSGSFDSQAFPGLTVFHADIEVPRKTPLNFVACMASAMPFANRSFDAVILNHSFEHFMDLQQCVLEIARVLATTGLLYIAVPDASTITDRVYRWLGRGGGHINPFTDEAVIPDMITAATGLRHAGTRVLCTSLCFLNRRNFVSKPPLRLLLFGNGQEHFVRVATFSLRCLDKWFGWRTSVYGWAFYFGDLDRFPDATVWSNVCIRCGSGHPSALLKSIGGLHHRRFLPAMYWCPACATRNYFTEDRNL